MGSQHIQAPSPPVLLAPWCPQHLPSYSPAQGAHWNLMLSPQPFEGTLSQAGSPVVSPGQAGGPARAGLSHRVPSQPGRRNTLSFPARPTASHPCAGDRSTRESRSCDRGFPTEMELGRGTLSQTLHLSFTQQSWRP